MIENKAIPPFGPLQPGGALWRVEPASPSILPHDHKPLQTSTIPVDNFVGNLVIKRDMARLQGTKIGLLKNSAGKSF
ncbi:hypothetical protein [Roseateles depolymerans]|uniref:hypothetical protein n=1 Tax=Roseateles depolymerans TaxID=76731 RepID=UPI0011C065CD|nr:hypothetical protein [Roseateles depolymerans]